MKFNTHETDLQILCETEEEKTKLKEFCKSNKLRLHSCYSNVSGQDWYGKSFFEIDFRSDLMNIIKNFCSEVNPQIMPIKEIMKDKIDY